MASMFPSIQQYTAGPQCPSMKGLWSPKIRRIILTQLQAAEIYEMKPAVPSRIAHQRSASQSRMVAERYGVSSKTVRDIWNKKTWIFATMHLQNKTADDMNFVTKCSGQSGICEVRDFLDSHVEMRFNMAEYSP